MTRHNGLDADDAANPFASPADVEPSQTPAEIASKSKRLELKQTTFPNALARWTLICAVAAGPSFAMALGMTSMNPLSIAAMVIGILVFAFGYAYLDISPLWRRWMSQSATRRAIITVFGIRVGASIVFPVAMMNDLFVGAFSLGAVQTVARVFGGNLAKGTPNGRDVLGPLTTLATTVVEGALLNVEILFVGLVFFAIFRAFESGVASSVSDSESDSPFSTQEKFE